MKTKRTPKVATKQEDPPELVTSYRIHTFTSEKSKQPWKREPMALVDDVPSGTGVKAPSKGSALTRVVRSCQVWRAGEKLVAFTGPHRLGAAKAYADKLLAGATEDPGTVCVADRGGQPIPWSHSNARFMPFTDPE